MIIISLTDILFDYERGNNISFVFSIDLSYLYDNYSMLYDFTSLISMEVCCLLNILNFIVSFFILFSKLTFIQFSNFFFLELLHAIVAIANKQIIIIIMPRYI